MTKGKLVQSIEGIAYHRNGICGEGFYVVAFRGVAEGPTNGKPKGTIERFIATVFHEPGTVAVLSLDRLESTGEKAGIEFGFNSWRGDHFEPELRAAISAHNEALFGTTDGTQDKGD